MPERVPQAEEIRSNDVLNSIINEAIQEVCDSFNDDMSERDMYMLSAVMGEVNTSPDGRLIYLRQSRDMVGVSKNMKEYINQVLLTVKQKFNQAEIEKCRAPFGGSLLDEII